APGRIIFPEGLTERVAALGNCPYSPPLLVADLEDTSHELMRCQVSGTVHDPAVLIFYLGSSPLELLNDPAYSFQDVQGFKTSDYHRHLVARADGFVLLVPHNRADMAGAQEPLDAVLRRLQDRRDSWGYTDVRHKQGEIPDAELLRLIDSH